MGLMGRKLQCLVTLACLGVTTAASVDIGANTTDPCAVIGGQKWVSPQQVRACFTSIAVNETTKANIIEVITKTLAFHTSVHYEIQAPEPFAADVHEDLFADLERIQGQQYPSDYDLHVDLSSTFKRLDDGHCVWINQCYDSLFLNFLPIPLTLLTNPDGSQDVHIAPEAFELASVEFADQIEAWQNALPGNLRGQLESLSGAKVLSINDKPPSAAVDANAAIAGTFQGFGTRQNMFFSGYQSNETGWTYIMGDFAQQSLPRDDQVVLEVQRVNQTSSDIITLPYRSRISSESKPFTDKASFLANNCVAIASTNGVDAYASSNSSSNATSAAHVQRRSSKPARKQLRSAMLKAAQPLDMALPLSLQPKNPVNGSRNAAQFYMQKDGKTGVMALGLFEDSVSIDDFQNSFLVGLTTLKSMGATQLIVDVSNNGGGFVCSSAWLHRLIIGSKSTTIPNANLQSQVRDGPLAQLIVKQIIATNGDPDALLLYNPFQWTDANNTIFANNTDWLQPPVNVTINGHPDAFSQRLGSDCLPQYLPTAPTEGFFDAKNVVIVSNGWCASSCAIFSITMAKEEGVRTVVVGGRASVKQQYCGTVGGISSVYSTIDTEIKTTHLKDHPLAPPDLIVNGIQGITWQLSFGVDDPTQPEEWQDHPADLNLPLTADIVNNPALIWEAVATKLLN